MNIFTCWTEEELHKLKQMIFSSPRAAATIGLLMRFFVIFVAVMGLIVSRQISKFAANVAAEVSEEEEETTRDEQEEVNQ